MGRSDGAALTTTEELVSEPSHVRHVPTLSSWSPMVTHFEETLQRDISRIRAKVTEMGGLAEGALKSCVQALRERNRQVAYSVILRDQNRNVFISAGMCLVLKAVFFGTCFACRQLGDQEYITPALAAWLPVFIYGPLAAVLFDAVHT